MLVEFFSRFTASYKVMPNFRKAGLAKAATVPGTVSFYHH